MNQNRDVTKELKQAYCVYAKARMQRDRNIKLPSTLGIERDGGGLLLRLTANSVTSNMQSDAAAFEAWALALRLWLGEERVSHITLDWESPASEPPNGHHERFLYRVHQFHSLFPEWFYVADSLRVTKCRALSEPLPILNVASGAAGGTRAEKTNPENELELRLIGSEPFCRHFGLSRVDRQFPVGLFAGIVSAKTHIFTGGKSAIDIVGIAKDGRFFVFELKVSNNIKVGTLSELLLYTSLIREAACAQPRIGFHNAVAGSRACIHPRDVLECTGITAVMLVEELHPLLEHPELLSVLNQAAEVYWNSTTGAKPVCFSKALVSDFEKAAEAND